MLTLNASTHLEVICVNVPLAFTGMVKHAVKVTVLNLTVQQTNSVSLLEDLIVSVRPDFIVMYQDNVSTQTNVSRKIIVIKIQRVQTLKEVITAIAKPTFSELVMSA